uniref:Protein SPT2 homolog n=1 Tax=Petromyzon marinus TaxID=7757 RepID=A0AAJ7UKV9_PETMA|nr:protein SPT2 homolog [Petromyzon marinus]
MEVAAARGDPAGCPGGSGASPGGSGASPGGSGASPGGSGASPGVSGASPGGSGASPGGSGASPGVSGASPGGSGASPGGSGASPGGSGASPGVSGASSGVSGASSGVSGASPGGSGASPGVSWASPGGTGASPGGSWASLLDSHRGRDSLLRALCHGARLAGGLLLVLPDTPPPSSSSSRSSSPPPPSRSSRSSSPPSLSSSSSPPASPPPSPPSPHHHPPAAAVAAPLSRSALGPALLGASEELGRARVALRLLGHAATLREAAAYRLGQPHEDTLVRALSVLSHCVDCLFVPMETGAWAADLGLLLPQSLAQRLWGLSAAVWAIGLALDLARSARKLVLLSRERREMERDGDPESHVLALRGRAQAEWIRVVAGAADLASAVHWLGPPGVAGPLWSGRLPHWALGALGCVSSAVILHGLLARGGV